MISNGSIMHENASVQEAVNVNVAIIVFPFASPAAFHFARKLIEVVAATSRHVVFISGGIPEGWDEPEGCKFINLGDRFHRLSEKTPRWWSAALWVAKMLWFQIRASIQILRMRNSLDILICAQGWYHQLPIVTGRALGKRVLCTVLGDVKTRAEKSYGRVIGMISHMLARFNYSCSQMVIAESKYLVGHSVTLSPYAEKVYVAPTFVDLDNFIPLKEVKSRRKLIGFVGRLTVEKGFSELLEAIPTILERHPDVEFLIVGDGPLAPSLNKLLESDECKKRVTWKGWVDQADITTYLNEMKLLVLPSYTEGLPNIVLEAMACGTPVLASNVGGLPDVIKDGQTGFVLDQIGAQPIIDAIDRALSFQRLSEISRRARKLMEREYSFNASKCRYLKMFEEIRRKAGQ